MVKMYYCNENDEYLTSETIRKEWLSFRSDGESFSDYLENCMNYNNGSLQTIENREYFLKRKLSKLSIDRYSIDEAINTVLELQRLYEFIERNEQK